MLILISPEAESSETEALLAQVQGLSPHAKLVEQPQRLAISFPGTLSPEDERLVAAHRIVQQIVPIQTPYKLASRELHPQNRVVRCGSLQLGGVEVGMIAGPCSVESEAQILQCARVAKQYGATALRGGAFKPRTSPYSFQGLKEEGLKLLALARQETGLAVVTEVVSPDQVDLVANYADCLQIGARNMQNYALLEAVGKAGKPVLLKRGPSATMDEFLLAAEYVLASGNPDVMLCERGIRTFENHTRFTLPLASVPYLKQKTHLPVVIDPSHGTGKADLVPSMAAAAVAAGCDGLIVEMHPDPARSVSDAAQTLSFEQFQATVQSCQQVALAVGRKWASLAGPNSASVLGQQNYTSCAACT